jgi:hypothetical protein
VRKEVTKDLFATMWMRDEVMDFLPLDWEKL